MNQFELEQAILRTLADIARLKEDIDRADNQKEIRRLRRKLKELQYLQLWQVETYQRLFD